MFTVDWRAIDSIPADRGGHALTFRLPHLEVQKVIVMREDASVRREMEAGLAEMQERLRAMEARRPVPKDETS